ncbi:indole-3-glycerol-phosphate synthase [Methanomassiliicoccus luminyensis]|jgi:indole-3-glycerol phosphate synthase|uniref:indole-3-glycerol-phosphate synthase n=1 Tax=Methanomassiliicoccus luminyensis TaxID=1080712 RepID=UPI0003777BF5|nr:indole-3-glycerol-phosphate synthase [Methanomassiliicoccus luminyensis]
MADHLEQLVENARGLAAGGYYDFVGPSSPGPSLSRALRSSASFPIIAEVKLSSPSQGDISSHSPRKLVRDYMGAGAAALSVLTEPNRFKGSLDSLLLASAENAPVLMKDIIVSREQIRAGATRGASALLLIEGAFGATGRKDRDDLVAYAHELGVEVVLEAGRAEEINGIMSSEADVLGFNQRDLRTLTIDPGAGARNLPRLKKDGRPVVVMSGIGSREQVVALKDSGADAVLVGTSLSSSPDPGAKLRSMAVPR